MNQKYEIFNSKFVLNLEKFGFGQTRYFSQVQDWCFWFNAYEPKKISGLSLAIFCHLKTSDLKPGKNTGWTQVHFKPTTYTQRVGGAAA